MPRRTTGARAKDSLSVEEQAKRDKVDLLLKDLEVQAEQLIMEKKREIEAVSTSITTMYKVSYRMLFADLEMHLTLFLPFLARFNEDPQSPQERPLGHLHGVT